MSDDIFHSWKDNRFIVLDHYLLDVPGIVVVLTDIGYWAENLEALQEWCKVNGGQVKGMSVSFDNQEQLMLFALRWV
jgi:hypothetical protein